MEKHEIFKELVNRKKSLEELGYIVIYIGLYGSQNYSLDDEESDIDVKAIVLPTLNDIIFRNVISKTIEYENGTTDIKDLITFYDVIKKGNFSYIESIDTQYSIGDKYIKELFSKIRPNKKSLLGAMMEKRKALTHEYPSKTKEFEKWGCDPKQYHHILRLYDLIERLSDESFFDYKNDKRQYDLIEIKRNYKNLSKEFMEQDSDEIINNARCLIDYEYKYEYTNIDKEVLNYIENGIREQLFNSTNGELSARQYRTFGNEIPKKDIQSFPILKDYKGQDISYIIYERLEIL